VRPEACIEAQLHLARAAGAQTEIGTTVLELAKEGGAVRIVTNRGELCAKRVVLAAGAWNPELASGWYANLRITRQVLFWFTATDPALWDQRRCPVFIWTNGARTEDLVYGFPMADARRRIKIGSETSQTYRGDLLDMPPVSEAETEWIYRTHVAPRLNGVDLPCVEAKTCRYTEAPDYRFIIDRHPTIAAVTVVSACSGHGFKHSAALGEAIAEMIVGERATQQLSRFAIERLQP
jgi:sarcosine oxidase